MRIPPFRLCLPLAALAVLAFACGGDDDGGATATPGADGNLLQNPGFEQGAAPWIGLSDPATTFTVSDAQAKSGAYSAFLHMRDIPNDEGEADTHSKVYYLVQEITPQAMPEVVRGNYFVENWAEGAPFQYLQFVMIAFNPTNFESSGAESNWQIRYPLAGIDSQPFAIGNAKFRYVTREAPAQGQWVPFEVHPKDDFADLWGMVPEGFTSLRLLFEVRWDQKAYGEGSPSADVYYDDLYAGDD